MKKRMLITSVMLIVIATVFAMFPAQVSADTSASALNQKVTWPWANYLSISFVGKSSSLTDWYDGTATCNLELDANDNYCFSITVTAAKRIKGSATLTLTNVSDYKLNITYSDSTSIMLEPGGTITKTVEAAKNSTATGNLSIANVVPVIEKTFSVTIEDIIGDGNITSIGEEKADVATALTSSESVIVTTDSKATLEYTVDAYEGYAFFGFMTSTNDFIAVNNYWASSNANVDYSASVTLEESMTVTPVFVPYSNTLKSNTAVFEVNGLFYPYLDLAVKKAVASGGTIVAIGSGTVRHSAYNGDSDDDSTKFTIPSGVSLLLPYKSGQNSYDSASGAFPYANYVFSSSSSSQLDPQKAWLTVQIELGTWVENKGNIIVGGQLSGRTGAYAGATVGNTTSGFARLILEGDYTKNNVTSSQLKMGTGSVLSVCGYVTGAGTIDASAENVSIYQPLVVIDYRGGSYVTGAAADSIDNIYISVSFINYPVDGAGIPLASFPGGEYLFPMTQYSLRNIQTKIIIGDKSCMHSYIVLYTDEMASGIIPESDNQSTIPLIGAKSKGCLYQLDTNAEVTISYDSEKYVSAENSTAVSKRKLIGRTNLVFSGDVYFSNISLNVKVLSTDMSLSSSIGTFFIPYNFSILLEDGCTFTILNKLALYPGAEFIVEEGATLDIQSKLFVFDGLYEQSSATGSSAVTREETAYSNAQGKYPTSKNLEDAGFSQMATLVVNGLLKVSSGGSLGGIIHTTANNATIDLQECTQDQLLAKQQVGLVGSWSVSAAAGAVTVSRYFAGATLHTLDAMVYNSATGELVKLEAGKTYKSYYGELGEDGIYTNTISYTKDNFKQDLYTTSADPTSYVTRTIDYSATVLGEWYTESDIYAFRPEYRLNDYIWLNATFKVGSAVTVPEGATEIDSETSLVNVNGTYYLVRKVLSTELTDELAMTVCGDQVIASFERVKEITTDETRLELIDSMLAYGEAAKVFFSKQTVADDAVLTLPEGLSTALDKHSDGAATTLNGFSISTAGVEFTFNEQIGMTLHMVLKQNGNETTFDQLANIVQIGVLVGDASSNKVLTANSGEYDAAYLFYQSDGVSAENPSYPDIPTDTDFTTGTIATQESLSNLSACTVSFDLKSAEYEKTFSLRLYIVVDNTPDVTDDDNYSVLYGTQYHYGLGNYIARTYNSEFATLDEGYDMNAYKNFMVATWNYKEAASAAFGS